VVARTTGDSHLEPLEATIPGLAARGATFILIGRAQTIPRFKATLKRLDVPSHRVASKAYWALGKTGLD
jgi:hypothetical protein